MYRFLGLLGAFLIGVILGLSLDGSAESRSRYQPSGILVDLFNDDLVTVYLTGNVEVVLNHLPGDRKPFGIYKSRHVPIQFEISLIKPREFEIKERDQSRENEKDSIQENVER